MDRFSKSSLVAKVFISALLMSVGQAAHPQGWDVVATGKIVQIATSAPTNFAFRVTLDNGLTACGAGFAYQNAADPSYQTFVSTMLTAYAMQKNVTLYIMKDGGTWCRVVDTNVG